MGCPNGSWPPRYPTEGHPPWNTANMHRIEGDRGRRTPAGGSAAVLTRQYTLVLAAAAIALTGCSRTLTASPAPSASTAPSMPASPSLSMTAVQEYETLLTTPLPATGLPDQLSDPPLSKFVYADSGPDNLVGTVQAHLTPPSAGSTADLLFEVFTTPADAQRDSFHGSPAPPATALPSATPLAVSKGTGFCVDPSYTTGSTVAYSDIRQCRVTVGNIAVGACSSGVGWWFPDRRPARLDAGGVGVVAAGPVAVRPVGGVDTS